MQQDGILAPDIVMLMLVSQAVMTAVMNRNGTSQELSGACLKSSSNNNDENDSDNNNNNHNAFQLMMS